MRPIQSPIQWVYVAVSPATKRRRREAGHLPPSTAEVLNVFRCSKPPPQRLQDAGLKQVLDKPSTYLQAAALDNSVNIHQWFLIPIF